MGRVGTAVRAAVSAGLALASVLPGSAQVLSNEQIFTHGIARSYTHNVPYTPSTATGANSRVVVAVVFSEYKSEEEVFIADARLGGVSMTPIGTQENQANKKNRISAFYIPESAIPASGAFGIDYGGQVTAQHSKRNPQGQWVTKNPGDPSTGKSIVYLTTARRVRQPSGAGPGNGVPHVFRNNCSTFVAPTNRAGTIDFNPIAADASDILLSFVGTGDADSEATFPGPPGTTIASPAFRQEIFDQQITAPTGFSLAGAYRSVPVTTAGGYPTTATMTEGCQNRPITMQMVLEPLGSTATLVEDELVVEGDPFVLTVTDPDINAYSGARDLLQVTVTNTRTGETATVTLLETGNDTGVFSAQLPTAADPAAGSSTDGVLNVQIGDELVGSYTDTLTGTGGTATLTDDTLVVGPGGPQLSGQKSVASIDSYNLPGDDILYTLTVTNTGGKPVDAGSLFVVDTLPPEITFLFGDPVAGDGSTDPVLFTQTSNARLDWSFPRDAGFSRAGTPPADMAACSDAPGTGYDPTVRHVCFAPDNRFPPGPASAPPSWAVTFRARVK